MDGMLLTEAAIATTAEPTPRLARLFDAYYDRLYRLARRMTGTRDDALDLVQETFMRAAARPAAVPDDAEEAWLVRVMVNVQRDAWRKRRVRLAYVSSTHHDEPAQDPESARVASATIWKAVTALPPRRRAAVILHELEGRPVADVAAVLGISRATVRWHLFRARAELSAALQAPGRTR